MNDHLCHAVGCDRPVPPRLLFCPSHWSRLPRPLQALVWRFYVPGQEDRKDPTASYLAAQELAVAHTLIVDARRVDDEARRLVARARKYAERAGPEVFEACSRAWAASSEARRGGWAHRRGRTPTGDVTGSEGP